MGIVEGIISGRKGERTCCDSNYIAVIGSHGQDRSHRISNRILARVGANIV